jgi:hypothetical protein
VLIFSFAERQRYIIIHLSANLVFFCGQGKGFKDSKIQGFKDSKIQRFKDSKIQRFKDSKIQRFKDSKIQGFKDSIPHVRDKD